MALPSEYDTRFWLALLHEMDSLGNSVKPSDIYPRMRKYFPDINDQDLQTKTASGGNKWTNMIQWTRQHLVYRGCIDNSMKGCWVMTDLGRNWLRANWHGPSADYSQVVKPPIVRKPSQKPNAHETRGSRKASDGNGQADNGHPPEASDRLVSTHPSPPTAVREPTPAASASLAPLVIVDPVVQLCQRLLSAQRSSGNPLQFEQALSEAFTFLGLESKHIGGSSEPDIYLQANLGQSSYSVVVDAKSTHSGKVPDGQIRWPVIDSYRNARGATFAAVIGEDFSGGQLQTFANQYRVALITTGMILDLIKLHSEAPLNLLELQDLFSVTGRADAGLKALVERHNRNRHHWQLITEVVATIERFQQTTPRGTAPKVENLHFHLMLKNSHAPTMAPTLQDVSDAVAFLASPAVGVLVEVQGSNGAYLLATNAATARLRLLALARFFDDPQSSGDPKQSFGLLKER